jgi:hypothetical protein
MCVYELIFLATHPSKNHPPIKTIGQASHPNSQTIELRAKHVAALKRITFFVVKLFVIFV